METYVEFRDNGYWLVGSRVSLDSIVYCFREGQSPESIAENFSVLSLEKVYGAITFYLSNQKAVGEYLIKAKQEGNRISEEMNERLKRNKPLLYKRLQAAKADAEALHQ